MDTLHVVSGKFPQQLSKSTLKAKGDASLRTGLLPPPKGSGFPPKLCWRYFYELIGPDSTFVPRAVLDLDKVELEADEVEIICRPNQKRKISTRTIDGKKCVVIEIESGVMVNGLPLVIE